MKRITFPRFLAGAALAAAALGAASAAHARSDVYFSVGVQGPPVVYVEPAPVYLQPRQVYVQPQPVYVQPSPGFVQPQAYPAPYGYSYEDERAWRRAEWRRAEWRRQQYWRHHHHDWQEQSRGRDSD